MFAAMNGIANSRTGEHAVALTRLRAGGSTGSTGTTGSAVVRGRRYSYECHLLRVIRSEMHEDGAVVFHQVAQAGIKYGGRIGADSP